MYSIMTVGTGYLGEAIAKEFLARKQKVFGMTRSNEKAEVLDAFGIQPLQMDLEKPETLLQIPPAHFIVIAISPENRDVESYRRTYLDCVRHFFDAIKKNPRPFLILYISSTGVWDDPNLGWVDERDVAIPQSDRAKVLLEAEEQVLRSDYPSIIFRLSGIYGPGRHRLRGIDSKEILRENKFMNMIHLEDIVQSVPILFNKGTNNEIYIGTDSHPVSRKDFFLWANEKSPNQKLEEQCSALKPSQEATGKRIRNSKILQLGVQLKYPSFREGYEDLLK